MFSSAEVQLMDILAWIVMRAAGKQNMRSTERSVFPQYNVKWNVFQHTKSTPSSQCTNYCALYSIIFSTCIYSSYMEVKIQSSSLHLFCSYESENPSFSFLKCYCIVFQGKSTDFSTLSH